MKKKPTPKQRVLRKYPDAAPCCAYNCAKHDGWVIHPAGLFGSRRNVGRGADVRAAWKNAAERLK